MLAFDQCSPLPQRVSVLRWLDSVGIPRRRRGFIFLILYGNGCSTSTGGHDVPGPEEYLSP